jgi:hypothetical protein
MYRKKKRNRLQKKEGRERKKKEKKGKKKVEGKKVNKNERNMLVHYLSKLLFIKKHKVF